MIINVCITQKFPVPFVVLSSYSFYPFMKSLKLLGEKSYIVEDKVVGREVFNCSFRVFSFEGYSGNNTIIGIGCRIIYRKF